MQSDYHREYALVAFVDDDPKKIGKTIHGIPVVGNCHALAELVEKERIDTAFIAIPSATPEQLREIEQECESHKIEYQKIGAVVGAARG